MPTLKRAGQPAIHFEIDDYTDPWKQAPVMLL
jgi:3-oxoadipate enol-lactonase